MPGLPLFLLPQPPAPSVFVSFVLKMLVNTSCPQTQWLKTTPSLTLIISFSGSAGGQLMMARLVHGSGDLLGITQSRLGFGGWVSSASLSFSWGQWASLVLLMVATEQAPSHEHLPSPWPWHGC